MAIKSLELENVGPFRRRPDGSGFDGIKLEFDANVNLLIGPNNVGKSTVLQALASVTASHVAVRSTLPRAFKNAVGDVREDYNREGAEARLVWTNSFGDYRELWNILDKFVIWNTPLEPRVEPRNRSEFYDLAHLTIGGPDGLRDSESFAWEELVRDFGYVDYHNPASPRTEPAYVTEGPNLPKKAEGDEDDPSVYEAVNLKRLGSQFERNVFTEIDKVILEITKGFRVEIGTGVFADESEWREWREGQNKFATVDGEVTFPELSHGTRSVFAWVSQFMLGMAQHYQDCTNWKRRRGIFIIDEIDAHLHPSWQRRIIPTLTRHFPNVQIFASTHSPMMVAGLKAGQVHLLKRDETGTVVWSRNEQDIIGWTADEIYRTFMGIDDPTDERTARHAEELRLLRAKDSLTPEEQEQMQELRRLVNQDLLAGGHINAQRERFDAIMQEYLRSRMSGLSQDGA